MEDTQGKLPEGNNYNVSVQIAGGGAEIRTATLSGGDKRTMELDLSQWIRDNQTANKGKNFTVTYYAKVNEKAVVETKNSAKLEYGNEPGNTTKTTPSEVTTPTYPLDIKKTDTQSTLLAGAKFRLYKDEGDAKAANDNAIKVIGSDGNYTVAVDQKTEKNMDMVTLENEVVSGYNLRLNGLAAGTYWLVEKEAPAGYNKLTAPIKVTITQNRDNKLEWTCKVKMIVWKMTKSSTLKYYRNNPSRNWWNGYHSVYSGRYCISTDCSSKLCNQQKKNVLNDLAF